jgi:predicted transcriptional regulator
MENLHPTLWRTCRTLANTRRLACLKTVFANPGSSVEEIADNAHIPHDQASLCLRALQARGLLCAERHSRWVKYRPEPDSSVPAAAPILAAMRCAFFDDKLTDAAIMNVLTAFTHPRRLAILHRLQRAPTQSPEVLSIATQVSLPALWRHLRKLRHRNMVLSTREGWQLTLIPNLLARTLLPIIACDQA